MQTKEIDIKGKVLFVVPDFKDYAVCECTIKEVVSKRRNKFYNVS